MKILGDEILRTIAQELVETIRNNVTVDWTLRESVRANMRIKVRQVLRKHGYPPDKAQKATDTVIQQAELLSEEWASSCQSRTQWSIKPIIAPPGIRFSPS